MNFTQHVQLYNNLYTHYINSIHKHPQTRSPKKIPNRSPKSEISLRLFSGIIFTHKTNLSGSQIPQRVISLHTQTQRPGFGVQSVLRIITSTSSQTSTNSGPQKKIPNRSPKSEISLRLFSGIIFTHKTNLSGSQIPQRVISLHTQTQRPGFGVQSVLRIITSTSSQTSTNSGPQTDPKSEISLRLFSGIIFTHKTNLSGSQRSTKSHLFAHTNSETLLWGPKCPKDHYINFITNLHKLRSPNRSQM